MTDIVVLCAYVCTGIYMCDMSISLVLFLLYHYGIEDFFFLLHRLFISQGNWLLNRYFVPLSSFMSETVNWMKSDQGFLFFQERRWRWCLCACFVSVRRALSLPLFCFDGGLKWLLLIAHIFRVDVCVRSRSSLLFRHWPQFLSLVGRWHLSCLHVGG